MAKTTRPNTDRTDDVAEVIDAAVDAELPPEVASAAADGPVEPPVELPEPEKAAAEVVDDPAPPSAPPPAPNVTKPEEPKRSSGFGGMVVGGVIAAALGYGVAVYAPIAGLSGMTTQPNPLEATVAALNDRIVALEAAPAPAPVVDEALTARVQALEDAPPAEGTASAEMPDLAPLTDAIAGLDARIAALEAAPAATGGGASPDVTGQIESLRAEIEAMRGNGSAVSAEIAAAAADAQARLAEAEAQAAQMKAEAEETARKAMARAGISRLQAALESGAPFSTALADLPGMDVPAVLAEAAETGLPSQSALEDAFPAAARAALEASLQANMGDTWAERTAAFLQSTTGARSLAPREGTDPDAVLSRAEAAVKAGDLATALTELQGLPPEGQTAMTDFTAMAQKRLDAAAAVATLSAAIEG